MKRNPCIVWCSLLIFFLKGLNFPSFSQVVPIESQAAFAEKVYLQLDEQVYTADQTIWFKAIVANAGNHLPSIHTGVLYVELIGPDEQLMEKKLVKLADGVGDNFFELEESFPEGQYQVRAYTKWNKNFEDHFIFSE